MTHQLDNSERMPDAAAEAAVGDAIDASGLFPVFQPIVSLGNGEIVGYEALARMQDETVTASVLFDAAARTGRLTLLECTARRIAFESAAEWDAGLLFLNHSPPVVAEEGFVEAMMDAVAARPGLEPHRIVLEITERADFGDLTTLNRRITNLRTLGFQIALDDVGAGISGLNRIMALRPDWVKLDRELVANIDRDPVQQNLIRSLVRFARMSNMWLVAEGIERFDELAMLVRLGVHFGQGFYLARPSRERPSVSAAVRESIQSVQERIAPQRSEDPAAPPMIGLLQPVVITDRSTPVIEVADALEQPDHPDAAVLLDGRRYLGLVRRDAVLGACRRNGGAGPVDTLDVRPSCLIADDITLAEVLELAASRPDQYIADPFVVQRSGRIVGIVTLRNLLEAAAEARRRLPSHVAALTGLPSRVQADRWITARIRSADPTNIAFVDLAAFDAYNAAKGFEMGDAMLLRLVSLVESIMLTHDGDEFVAHLGEDRLMVASQHDLSGRLRRLVDEFDASRGEFFSSRELDAGVFTYTDAAGTERECPLTATRVVYLEQPLRSVDGPRSLYGLARRLRTAEPTDDRILRDRRRGIIERREIA